MDTAAEVIQDALSEILVQPSEAPIQADEAQTAIRAMNRMMAQFDSQGISLGYTKVTSLGDLVTIPDGALNGLVYNLALRLSPQFDAPVTQALVAAAADGLDAMRRLSVEIIPSSLPPTLPIGSGNEGEYCQDHFYDEDDTAILTETGAFISVEDETPIP